LTLIGGVFPDGFPIYFRLFVSPGGLTLFTEGRHMLVKIGDCVLHYDLLGREHGEVVCFLHALSSDTGVWAAQVPPLLEKGFRVLRLDMRGHGGSAAGSENFTMEDLAEDVAGILDFLAIKKVHLVGLSIGGMIAQSFAVSNSERLCSLMLCGTAPTRLGESYETMWVPRFAAMDEAGSAEPLADDSLARWVTDAFKPKHPITWQQIRESVANTSTAGYRGGGIAIEKFNVIDQLPQVSVRTLVICGDEDPGTPPEGNRRIAELIPGAQYREIPNARHFPMVEYPELFNCVMMEWLVSASFLSS